MLRSVVLAVVSVLLLASCGGSSASSSDPVSSVESSSSGLGGSLSVPVACPPFAYAAPLSEQVWAIPNVDYVCWSAVDAAGEPAWFIWLVVFPGAAYLEGVPLCSFDESVNAVVSTSPTLLEFCGGRFDVEPTNA